MTALLDRLKQMRADIIASGGENGPQMIDYGMVEEIIATLESLIPAVEFLLPRVSAHRPGCSLSEVPECNCGDWNVLWEAARTALHHFQEQRS